MLNQHFYGDVIGDTYSIWPNHGFVPQNGGFSSTNMHFAVLMGHLIIYMGHHWENMKRVCEKINGGLELGESRMVASFSHV